jgi:outer membrane receptor protein involved in Fe transport
MRARQILAFLILTAGFLAAQTFRGGIQGTVSDTTGASVSGAKVTVTSSETGLVRSAETDTEGNYTFTELPLGSYDVTAYKEGFRTATIKGVQVGVTISQRTDFKLTPGEVKQTVEVTADVPLVETTGNTIGGTIEAARAEELPVNGRDYLKLLTLVPGSNADPSSVNDAPGSFGIFSINGNRGRANNYLLDGTDMNDGYRNDPAINEAGVFGTPATILPVDALAEVGILSNMEPEYGRNSGATVNIVTKSGSNTLHGSGFEYFRNDAMDARNFFNATPNPKNSFHNNQFGGSLGGPLIKDRTFWFVAYEGQREVGGLPNIETAPTQAQIDAFVNGGGVVNPVIQRLLDRNPWNVPGGLPAGDPLNPGNTVIQVTDPFSNRVDSLILKLDHHMGGKEKGDLITGRYFFGDSDQSFPLALGAGSTVPGFNTVTPTRVQLISLSYTHVFTPKLLVEVRGGWNRFAEGFFPEDRAFDPSSIGLVTSAGLTSQDFGLPQTRFDDGTSSLGANNSIPRHRFDVNWQYFTNFSYNSGKHNWKFGYEFRRTSISQFYDLGYRGRLRFGTFEDFLAGNITDSASQFAGDSRRDTHQNNHSFYAQDNFRLSRKLTLNYGLRWDYYGVISEDKNRFSLFDPASDSLVLVGQSGGPSDLYPKDYNNFSPRFSLAYDVTGNGKTVVRAGWGLYYDAFSQDFFIGHFPFNTFNPGPAYNGIGTFAITAAGTFTPTIGDGVPIFSGFSPTTDAWTVDHNLRTPYIQNYNVNIQQELNPHAAFQVAYVGSTGRKLFRFRDINQADPATGNLPFAGFNIINNFESTARSQYHGLQLTLRLKNLHGVSSQVNYTWSHSIDDASDGEDYVPNAAQPDNSLNPQAERANSNFDSRHRFTWDFTYEIPGGQTAKWITKGWSLNGILRLSSGQPFTVHSFESFNGSNEFFERPDIIGDPFAGTHTPDAFLNLGAFAAPCTWDPVADFCVDGTGHFGNEPRNHFVGPNFRNFDFSLVKNTKLGDKVNMQFRADFFNIFNHPNFSNPLLPNFAVDLETNDAVQTNPANPVQGIGQGFLPITVTPDTGIGNPFLGGGGPRNIQLAIKFTF